MCGNEQQPGDDQGTVPGLSRIIGGLAHEIKNPLSTITLNLKLLGEDISRFHNEPHARIKRRLEVVRNEAERVKLILDDFLKCAGKYEIQAEETDFRNTIEELRDFLAPQAEATGVIFRTSLPDSPVICRIDVKLIKQAILNLVLNAIEVMDKGGELLLKTFVFEGRAVMEIIDTGPGIPSDRIEKIFTPYYSTKKSGSGLGLPIARRIIEDHNGTIEVESEDGKGTRFIVKLPLV